MTHQFFDIWLTVRHIPRKISRHCYFFREGDGNIAEHLISTTSEVSPIPNGGLEVSLLLKISVKSERIFKLIKIFVNLYDHDYTGDEAENIDDKGRDNEKTDIKLTEEQNATNEKVTLLVNLVFQMRFNLNQVFSSDA